MALADFDEEAAKANLEKYRQEAVARKGAKPEEKPDREEKADPFIVTEDDD